MRLLTITVEMLREDRAELSEAAEVAGAWLFAGHLITSRPAACLAAVQGDAIGLAIAELRTHCLLSAAVVSLLVEEASCRCTERMDLSMVAGRAPRWTRCLRRSRGPT